MFEAGKANTLIEDTGSNERKITRIKTCKVCLILWECHSNVRAAVLVSNSNGNKGLYQDTLTEPLP